MRMGTRVRTVQSMEHFSAHRLCSQTNRLSAATFFIFLFSTHVTDPWIDSPVTKLCQEHLDGLPDLMCSVNYLGFPTDKEVRPS